MIATLFNVRRGDLLQELGGTTFLVAFAGVKNVGGEEGLCEALVFGADHVDFEGFDFFVAWGAVRAGTTGSAAGIMDLVSTHAACGCVTALVRSKWRGRWAMEALWRTGSGLSDGVEGGSE